MYNAYSLTPGPSRELLAVVESARTLGMVVHVSSGTFICVVGEEHESSGGVGADDGIGVRFPEHHAGGFDKADGGMDVLDLCQKKNWTLNATKIKVGYLSCFFFGVEVDINGTRLADKNLDPFHLMVPLANLPELPSTFGIFVQSSVSFPNTRTSSLHSPPSRAVTKENPCLMYGMTTRKLLTIQYATSSSMASPPPRITAYFIEEVTPLTMASPSA
jgi:hypothetical protein